MTKISIKQQRFVDEYLIDMNGTQAAIRAGYSPKSVHANVTRMMRNDAIKTAIEAGRAKLAKKFEITQEWVVDRFKTIADRCMTDGKKIDSAGANKATEMLGKIGGVFKEAPPSPAAIININIDVAERKRVAKARAVAVLARHAKAADE